MIYQDYMRRKMHNVVKLDTAEGYPLTVYNCANKNLKDYTIIGNTVYSENLFNYTEPYNDDQIKADADGWFDVTIDNTSSNTIIKNCFTKVNLNLKTNTKYYLVTEVAERTGDIDIRPVNPYSTDSSGEQVNLGQFNYAERYHNPEVGIYKKEIVSRASFDNCISMLRNSVISSPNTSGHIKFRISVYETDREDFIPYSKQSVGDKTKNLFNYTEQSKWTYMVAPDENGWFDVTIDNSNGSSTVRKSCFSIVNEKLKTNTQYYIKYEEAERSGNPVVRVTSVINTGDKGQFASPELINASGYRTTLSSFDSCATMLRTYVACDVGESCHVKFRIAVYETQKDTFEPYDKYKIPITVTGKNLFDKSISIRDDIRNETTITSSDYSVPILKNNDICKILKPDTTYTISCEFECTAIPSDSTYRHGILGFIASTGVAGYSRISATIDKQMLVGERYKFSKTFTTPSNFGTEGKYSFVIYRNAYSKGDSTVAASMICRNLQIEEGTSATSYEPYHEPVTTNIYRDAPLADGESINYKSDSLPDIVLKKGTNVITADTEVKPSNIKIKYLKK